jgi:hypothetical protein
MAIKDEKIPKIDPSSIATSETIKANKIYKKYWRSN